MGVSNSKEPDLRLAEQVARNGCVLGGIVGSTVHGLSNPGTDDRDEMGVCVEPPQYIAGLRPFEHWVFRSQPEGAPSGPGDLDLTVYGLRKYCRLALKGSPTLLLLLFVGGEEVLERTEIGEELQALAPAFLSRRTGRAFLGYVDAQRRGLLGDQHATRTRELSAEHGYDTKYAMHALRIAHQGLELLTTGRISLPIGEPERTRLMEVRRGAIPLAGVLESLHLQSAALEREILDTRLPEEPDRHRVDRFLVNSYMRAWAAQPNEPDARADLSGSVRPNGWTRSPRWVCWLANRGIDTIAPVAEKLLGARRREVEVFTGCRKIFSHGLALGIGISYSYAPYELVTLCRT
jgi:hypothetical protein